MHDTILKSKVFLDHIAIESTNPKKIAEFYSKYLMMKKNCVSNSEWHCFGPNRLLIFKKGIKNKLSFAAFGCKSERELNKIRKKVLSEKIKIKEYSSIYLEKNSFSIYDPDNNKIVFGVPLKRWSKKNKYHAPLQHLTLQSLNVKKIIDFYHKKLGFAISDRVINKNGVITTCFFRSNKEHHSLACFKAKNVGIDHHSYEVGKWKLIRDWCDYISKRRLKLFWGPGRHGPGNNLFVFFEDCDGNKIELSAELELIKNRKFLDWPHDARTLNLWGKSYLRV